MDEIRTLNKESERYNNPSDFAKYAKIQRKAAQLDKRLNEIKGNNGDEVSLGLFSSLFSEKFIQFSYFKTFITFVLIVAKVYFIYFLSDKKLYFRDYDYVYDNRNNVIFENLRDSENYINIPIRYVIVLVWTLLL